MIDIWYKSLPIILLPQSQPNQMASNGALILLVIGMDTYYYLDGEHHREF